MPIDGEQIVALDPSEFTFIERTVALYKMLLNHVFDGPSVKWIFSRIDIETLPRDDADLVIEVRQKLGTRIVKGAVSADGSEVGSIWFSGVPM